MNHNFGLWLELWFKLWFGVWLKLWPKIEESSMISLRGGGLVAAFFWCARGDPGSRARPGPRDPGARARPGPARAKNAAASTVIHHAPTPLRPNPQHATDNSHSPFGALNKLLFLPPAGPSHLPKLLWGALKIESPRGGVIL